MKNNILTEQNINNDIELISKIIKDCHDVNIMLSSYHDLKVKYSFEDDFTFFQDNELKDNVVAFIGEPDITNLKFSERKIKKAFVALREDLLINLEKIKNENLLKSERIINEGIKYQKKKYLILRNVFVAISVIFIIFLVGGLIFYYVYEGDNNTEILNIASLVLNTCVFIASIVGTFLCNRMILNDDDYFREKALKRIKAKNDNKKY